MTTTMDRWNPFREMLALRDVMDRMFDDTFYRSNTPTADRASSFPIDLAETDRGFLLLATLPGVTPEQVQITIHGDTLTIRGLGSSQDGREDHNWIIRERRGGSYHRMVTLPAPVNPEQAEAHFKDGILELTLPKVEAARPHQIKVGVGMAGTAGAAGMRASEKPASKGSAAEETDPTVSGSTEEADVPPQDAAKNSAAGATSNTASGTASGSPANPPSTHPDKDVVTEASEESMAASDPPSWTQERT